MHIDYPYPPVRDGTDHARERSEGLRLAFSDEHDLVMLTQLTRLHPRFHRSDVGPKAFEEELRHVLIAIGVPNALIRTGFLIQAFKYSEGPCGLQVHQNAGCLLYEMASPVDFAIKL